MRPHAFVLMPLSVLGLQPVFRQSSNISANRYGHKHATRARDAAGRRGSSGRSQRTSYVAVTAVCAWPPPPTGSSRQRARTRIRSHACGMEVVAAGMRGSALRGVMACCVRRGPGGAARSGAPARRPRFGTSPKLGLAGAGHNRSKAFWGGERAGGVEEGGDVTVLGATVRRAHVVLLPIILLHMDRSNTPLNLR